MFYIFVIHIDKQFIFYIEDYYYICKVLTLYMYEEIFLYY